VWPNCGPASIPCSISDRPASQLFKLVYIGGCRGTSGREHKCCQRQPKLISCRLWLQASSQDWRPRRSRGEVCRPSSVEVGCELVDRGPRCTATTTSTSSVIVGDTWAVDHGRQPQGVVNGEAGGVQPLAAAAAGPAAGRVSPVVSCSLPRPPTAAGWTISRSTAPPACRRGGIPRSLQQIWLPPALHARILELPLDGHELVHEDRSGGDCAGIV